MTIPIRGNHPPIDDELLSAYLDGQVSPAEREAVAAALAVDPTMRARLNDLRATVTLLRSLPQPVPRRTFILTPQQAAAIRPVRVPWLTRIFPTVAAVSAVAAVLCLMLIAGDLATGGFGTRTQQVQQTPVARSAVESASSAATETASPAIAVATVVSAPLPAAPASPAPAAAATITGRTAALFPPATGATGSAPGNLAPSSAGASAATAPPAPTEAPTAVPTATLPPTVVANVQPTAPVATTPTLSPGGATVVTTETHRVPVALVRAGEIVLALLAAAGITLAVLSRRSRTAQR